MMIGIMPYLFEIVMLTGDANDFLRIRRSAIGTGAFAKEDVLELVHTRIGKEQRFIPMRNHWRARHDLMPALTEKIKKALSDLFGSHVAGKNNNARGMFKRVTL